MVKKLFLIGALLMSSLDIVSVQPAVANTAIVYQLMWLQYSPWGKSYVSGPYYTFQECDEVRQSKGLSPYGIYECDAFQVQY